MKTDVERKAGDRPPDHPTARFLAAAGIASSFAMVASRNGDIRVRTVVGPALGSATDGAAQVEVHVVSALHPAVTAAEILAAYLRQPANFAPDRCTEGSFLIVDRRRGWVGFGRDRSACQRLYAASDAESLYVSSRMEPFLGTVCREIDPLGQAFFLATGITAAAFPLYKGLHAVLPGRWIWMQTAGAPPDLRAGSVFWDVQRRRIPESYDKAVDEYGEIFLENVRCHADGKPSGLYLSGGSDSACVVGAMAKLGLPDCAAAHMHIPGHHGDLELRLVRRLQEAFGFHLDIVRPRDRGEDRMAHILESTRMNPAGSYMTFPWYRWCAEALGARLPEGAAVFNGELCLLDVGFSTANEFMPRWIRRWLFRGAGRHLSHLGPVFPARLYEATLRSSPPASRAGKAVDLAFDLVYAIGRPSVYFAGLKAGSYGLPGIGRGLYAWAPDLPWRQVAEALAGLLEPFASALRGPDRAVAMASLTAIWYAEASNFTMGGDALDPARSRMVFPFSSVDLMDFSASLPESWTRDKRIQKDMSHRVLGLPPEVAYFQKDHSRGPPYETIAYSATERDGIRSHVRRHDFGSITRRARLVEDAVASGRTSWLQIYPLFCLAVHAEGIPAGRPQSL